MTAGTVTPPKPQSPSSATASLSRQSRSAGSPLTVRTSDYDSVRLSTWSIVIWAVLERSIRSVARRIRFRHLSKEYSATMPTDSKGRGHYPAGTQAGKSVDSGVSGRAGTAAGSAAAKGKASGTSGPVRQTAGKVVTDSGTGPIIGH